jgi:PKD repeat protein
VPVDLPSFFANESGGFVPAVSSLGMTVATVTPSLGPRSLHVSVHAVASGPGGASVGWLFGDGDSSLIPNTTYVYGLAGRYNAEATATDPFGDQVVLTDGIFVTVPISIVGGPAPVSGTAPLAVAFSASAAGGVGGTYAYSWSFGDGSTATGAQANHTYSSPGTYVITVNVTDGAGEGAQDRWNVTVSAGYGYPVLIFLVGGAGAVIAVVAVLVWDRRSRRPFTP